MCKKEKFYSIFSKNRRVEGQRPSTLTAVSEIFIIYFSVSSTTVSVSSGRGKGFLFLPKAKKVRLG